MSNIDRYTKFISEQVRKGDIPLNESHDKDFAKVIKEVDRAEKNGADASHNFHSKDDHEATVKKLVSHLKKAGHRDVEVEPSGAKNDTYVYSTHGSGEGMSHSVISEPHEDGSHDHEVYTSVNDSKH
jgi:hypothetical protein